MLAYEKLRNLFRIHVRRPADGYGEHQATTERFAHLRYSLETKEEQEKNKTKNKKHKLSLYKHVHIQIGEFDVVKQWKWWPKFLNKLNLLIDLKWRYVKQLDCECVIVDEGAARVNYRPIEIGSE